MSRETKSQEIGRSTDVFPIPKIPPDLAQILLLDSFEKYTPELAQKINEVFTQFSFFVRGRRDLYRSTFTSGSYRSKSYFNLHSGYCEDSLLN